MTDLRATAITRRWFLTCLGTAGLGALTGCDYVDKMLQTFQGASASGAAAGPASTGFQGFQAGDAPDAPQAEPHSEEPAPKLSNGMVAYKRSGRGRRVSAAARAHNANRLYSTQAAAEADAPHAGDHSRTVRLTIPRERYERYFGLGAVKVDLRHVM